jgi:hypothetical protein
MQCRVSIAVAIPEDGLSTSQPPLFYLLMLLFGPDNKLPEIKTL